MTNPRQTNTGHNKPQIDKPQTNSYQNKPFRKISYQISYNPMQKNNVVIYFQETRYGLIEKQFERE